MKPEEVEASQTHGEGEEEEIKEHDPEINVDTASQVAIKESQVRDRVKNQKFMQMLHAGQIPDYIAKEFEASKKMGSGKRDRQTLIINSLFDRSAAGRLLMNQDKPMFQSMKVSYQDSHSKETTTSLSKTLFCGKFGLTKEMFQEGLANGEFHEVETTSGTQYAWVENSHTKKQGEKSSMGWKAEGSGGRNAMQAFEAASSSWKMGLMIKKAPGSSSSAAGPSLALCDVNQKLTDEQWETVKSQCSEACQSLDKMEKDALKLLKDLEEDDEMWVKLLLGCQLHKTCCP